MSRLAAVMAIRKVVN